MDDKVFENDMELLELSFKSAKPAKIKNDWDRWQEIEDDYEYHVWYAKKREAQRQYEEDLNERR